MIDVGCHDYSNYPEDLSVGPLIKRFNPSVLYGFDPAATKAAIFWDSTRVLIEPQAAWVYDGFIGFSRNHENGLRSETGEMCGPAAVPCFDLAQFICDLPANEEIVLKIDAEGAEHKLLPHLHEDGADALLSLILIEWHGEPLDLPFRSRLEMW